MNMRRSMLLTSMCMAILSCEQRIDTPPKQVLVDAVAGYVVFEGTWRALSQPGFTVIPKINTTTGHCSKQSMACTESIALLFSKSDRTLDKGTWLDVQVNTYQVLEWTPTTIYAREETSVNDIELRISLSDKSVERFSRETRARGASTANPAISRHWMLDGRKSW